jgi:flagellar hook-length control protein FliK
LLPSLLLLNPASLDVETAKLPEVTTPGNGFADALLTAREPAPAGPFQRQVDPGNSLPDSGDSLPDSGNSLPDPGNGLPANSGLVGNELLALQPDSTLPGLSLPMATAPAVTVETAAIAETAAIIESAATNATAATTQPAATIQSAASAQPALQMAALMQPARVEPAPAMTPSVAGDLEAAAVIASSAISSALKTSAVVEGLATARETGTVTSPTAPQSSVSANLLAQAIQKIKLPEAMGVQRARAQAADLAQAMPVGRVVDAASLELAGPVESNPRQRQANHQAAAQSEFAEARRLQPQSEVAPPAHVARPVLTSISTPQQVAGVIAAEQAYVDGRRAGMPRARFAIGDAASRTTRPTVASPRALAVAGSPRALGAIAEGLPAEAMNQLPAIAHVRAAGAANPALPMTAFDSPAAVPSLAATPVDNASQAAARSSVADIFVVAQQELPVQLAQRVMQSAAQNLSNFRIQLQPLELGQLDIQFKVNAEQLDLTFTAQQGATRELIESYLPNLRQLLSDNGIQLGDVEIRQAADNARQQAGQQFARGESDRPADASVVDDENLAGGETDHWAGHGRIIDAFA